MRMRPLLLLALPALGGCCRDDVPPEWLPIEPLTLSEGTTRLGLSAYVVDDSDDLDFAAATGADILVNLDGGTLELTPQPDFTGQATVDLTAWDACGNAGTTTLEVSVGDDGDDPGTVADACAATLTYAAQGSPDAVAVAGAWNEWDTSADRLVANGDGTWSLALELEPGAYAYKFVEITEGLYDEEQAWTCDPAAELIQCDAGYKSPDDTSWSHSCALNANSCNSLLVVPDCGRPSLSLSRLAIDRERGEVVAEVVAAEARSGATIQSVEVTLDGEPVLADRDGDTLTIEIEGLSSTRHALRVTAVDEAGYRSDELYVPFWIDELDWSQAVLYYAFVDRLADGDTDLNLSADTSSSIGDYLGGDWQGLIDLLPYLDDLGVNVLWLTNPQDNADGAWDGQCEETFAGYHGYWPVSASDLEGQFGDEATLRALIDEAHAYGMRVVVDWVGNHVHEDHPYVAAHPDWFGDYAWCEDADNWNDIPETCWFAPYLPDVDYYASDPLVAMVEDAIDLAREWDLDGLRVDAAKHMPHSVQWNLEHRVQAVLEHSAAGGDQEFWTVGETFDGYDQIKAYIGDGQLDGQFDFPLYYSVRAAFLDGSITLADLYDTAEYSQTVFDGAIMGTFLGNHDVARFTTEGAEDDLGACESDNSGVRQAEAPTDAAVYEGLRLAWTFLLTWPGVPLIYYGDEIGMPGYGDPDNRQPLWWYTGDLSGGAVLSVDDLAERVSDDQAAVLYTVRTLARARAEHPALSRGATVTWWEEPDLYAYARTSGDDAVLVILNRSWSDRTLSNGLSFAGLADGEWEDLLSGDVFTASDDSIRVEVPARGARVLVGSAG